MASKLDEIVIIDAFVRPATILDRLKDLVGRKADERAWALVDRLREEAILNGDIEDPEVALRLRFLYFQRNLQSVNFHAQPCSDPLCRCRR